MPLTFGGGADLARRKQTRREPFPAAMDHVVPWKALLGLIEPHDPKLGLPAGNRIRWR